MRRKKWLAAAAVVVLLCILVGGILLWGPVRVNTGIYIEAGEPMVVFPGGSGEPVVMRCGRDNDKMFGKMRTGDKILVFHDGRMMLSYPAQMNVFFCLRLKRGDISDVPEGVLESLERMGWSCCERSEQ